MKYTQEKERMIKELIFNVKVYIMYINCSAVKEKERFRFKWEPWETTNSKRLIYVLRLRR